MDPIPKTEQLRPYPRQWNLELVGAARLPTILGELLKGERIVIGFLSDFSKIQRQNLKYSFFVEIQGIYIVLFKKLDFDCVCLLGWDYSKLGSGRSTTTNFCSL